MGNINSKICKEYIFEMKEVNPRQFRAGINHKGGFLCFIRKGMRRLSASIFVNQRFRTRFKNSFLNTCNLACRKT